MTNVLTIAEESRKIAERIDPQRVGGVAVSRERGNLSFQDMGQVMEFAKLMAISDVAVPKHLRNNPGACLAVTIQALDWQLHPFQVANKSYSVNDRLAFESQLVQAVILARAPIKGRFAVEYSGAGPTRVCKITATLEDGTGTVDYTSPPFNAIKVKNSPLWTADPDQQLFYYSARALCRRHFPDVLLGIYTPDELPADAPRDVTPRPTLAQRFAKPEDASAGGFSVHHVDAETGEITESPAETAAVEEERPREPAHQPDGNSQAGDQVAPSSPAVPAKDAPVGDWIAFAEAVLENATAETVEDLWNNQVSGPLDDSELFPPDVAQVIGVFDRRARELEP